ncbi:uncharacterized protein A1O9_12164 [Exophiala aquamarina CBS 119918]|uniref:RapZ C-terminal domain-containing protein n=1 Tax=Exophiala aquamarina CBS 119918 TaxID=1182545 RepID=A0A072NWN3_9EURO|nr:uncharacterized protein A1O9_12164 [Exophiala aquamarina CBS 119918]KEF51827.1 hypothetical protein A1O9_12164 [Exophiala aquamarina CBS 119918]
MSQGTEQSLENRHVSGQASPPSKGKLQLISYGRSNGPLTGPSGAVDQLTFSVRDIANPPARLRRTHTGLSSRLRKEVMANKAAAARLESMCARVEAKMSEMASLDGSHVLFVGIMCEEGKHRSVTFAEELSRRIASSGWDIEVRHRDLAGFGHDDADAEEALDSDEANSPSSQSPGTGRRKGKKQQDHERKKGRSSAHKFVRGNTEEYEYVH